MKLNSTIRTLAVSAAMLALAGCGNLSRTETGTLAGAGVGAVAGSAVSNGGIVGPAIGAVGGAALGHELATPDRRRDY